MSCRMLGVGNAYHGAQMRTVSDGYRMSNMSLGGPARPPQHMASPSSGSRPSPSASPAPVPAGKPEKEKKKRNFLGMKKSSKD
ncbi:hypothetical protein BN1723_001592 [Verticillium longisporum]|uniref:Uncharacterized protein n=1 Tax=Verticillium longisporum TaxID=100787 RepID=A0A0G4KGP5_VERLO|nr:hypothetical protein BN1723_001592 [Verticillium longisporum]